jgi:hypothetical protein
MRVTSQRPVAILAACLGLDVAELHRIAPYLWRELRMSIADDEPESAGELGLWFVAGRPPFATVRVMRSGLVVMPAHPNRAGEIEIARGNWGSRSRLRLC